MLTAMAEYSIHCLNNFPARTGISQDLSPAAIVLGTPHFDCNMLKLSFGAYAQVYDSTDNSPKPRSVGGIALRPSNGRGGYYFMSLEFGKRIHSNQWTELPLPQHVIRLVEDIAKRQGQPRLRNKCPSFEWYLGMPVDEDDAVAPLIDPPVDQTVFPDNPNELPLAQGADGNQPPLEPPPNQGAADPGPPQAQGAANPGASEDIAAQDQGAVDDADVSSFPEHTDDADSDALLSDNNDNADIFFRH